MRGVLRVVRLVIATGALLLFVSTGIMEAAGGSQPSLRESWPWVALGGWLALVGMGVSVAEWSYGWAQSRSAARVCAVTWLAAAITCLVWTGEQMYDQWAASAGDAAFGGTIFAALFGGLPALVCLFMLRRPVCRGWRGDASASPDARTRPRVMTAWIATIHVSILGLFFAAMSVRAWEQTMVLPMELFAISFEEHRIARLERHYRHASPEEFAAIVAAVQTAVTSEHLFDPAPGEPETPPRRLAFLHAQCMYVGNGGVSLTLAHCFDDDVILKIERTTDGQWRVYGHFGDFMRPDELLWPK